MGSPEADAVAEATEALDLLRSDVLALAQLTLRQLMMDIKYGSIQQRNNAIRMVSPYLLRMLDASGEEDQLSTLKESITGLMAEVRGSPTPPQAT